MGVQSSIRSPLRATGGESPPSSPRGVSLAPLAALETDTAPDLALLVGRGVSPVLILEFLGARDAFLAESILAFGSIRGGLPPLTDEIPWCTAGTATFFPPREGLA